MSNTVFKRRGWCSRSKKHLKHEHVSQKRFVQLQTQIDELQAELDQRDSAEQLHRDLAAVQVDALREELAEQNRLHIAWIHVLQEEVAQRDRQLMAPREMLFTR